MAAEKKGFRFSIPDIKVRMGSFMMTFTPLQKNPAKHSTGMFLNAYEQKMEQVQAEQQTESEELDEDEEPAFEQSM